jgi:hypothetical protein
LQSRGVLGVRAEEIRATRAKLTKSVQTPDSTTSIAIVVITNPIYSSVGTWNSEFWKEEKREREISED